MSEAIAISGVTKTFGAKVAVRDLDLVVPSGAVCAFLGPNGAGKTTTIRMIMSILFPDRGEIRVLGRGAAIESKDRIGYLPEERGVYRRMRVGPLLKYLARLKGIAASGRELDKTVRGWLERVELADCYKKRCMELSKGMQQKVQFIAAVIHEPEMIILDEPFSGLDPVNARVLRQLINEQRGLGRTILFSTHVMEHAEQLCDHVFMINNGLKVLDASMSAVRSGHDPRVVEVDVAEDRASGAEEALAALPGVASVRRDRGSFILDLRPLAEARDVMRAVMERVDVRRVERARPRLEDIFISLVAGASREGGESENGSASRERIGALRQALREVGADEPGSGRIGGQGDA